MSRDRLIPLFLLLPLGMAALSCGRKGDPIPSPRIAPQACEASWQSTRILEIRLPLKDAQGKSLVGIEQVRAYYMPLGIARPEPADVINRGEIILEQRRPDLPAPGHSIRMNFKDIGAASGWIVVVAVRVGGVIGQPSTVLPWLNPEI